MDEATLSGCFTCMRKTDNFLRICDESNTEQVDQILERHFWFEKSDFEGAVLCTSCWEQIDGFHKFYCEVANVHQSDILLHRPPVSVKLEETTTTMDGKEVVDQKPLVVVVKGKRGRKRKKPLEDEEEQMVTTAVPSTGDVPVPVLVKVEILEEDHQGEEEEEHYNSVKEESDPEQDVTFGHSSEDDDEEDEESSDEESSKPIATRRRQAAETKRTPQRRNRKTNSTRDAFVRKYLDQLSCDQCDQQFDAYSALEKHSRKEHDSLPTVVCCQREYQKYASLYAHLTRHKTIFRFHCKECDRCFKNVDGLNMHNLLHHTPDEEKKFRCHLCDRAFVSEMFLTSHLNWHATVEPKNIVCQRCNKYFTNQKMLENHMTIQHPELVAMPESFSAVSDLLQQMDQPQLPPPTDPSAPAPEETVTENDIVQPIESSASIKKEATDGGTKQQQRRKTPEETAKEDELIRKYCAMHCDLCEYAGATYWKLEAHYRKVHDQRGYATCCGRKFSKKSRLYEHVLVHENPAQFKCDICAKTFLNSFGLANHMMWKHTPDSEKPFACDVCGNRFWKDYLLKQHMEYHLAIEEKKYACKECDRFFGTNLLLKSHEQTVHGLSASWVCDICAKGFPLKSALEFHRQQHTQEGRAALKAQCKHCKLWMKNIRSLRSHVKRCGSDPVNCDVCGKECSNQYSLQSHKKFVHANPITYSCSFCAKPFKRLLRLREHEAGHTGDLLYKCEYCPRTCNSSSNMYTHKKVAHPEQWAEKMASRFHKR